MPTPDGGSAFPSEHFTDDPYRTTSAGMTLRDYFAAHALMGLASHFIRIEGEDLASRYASHAYYMADAMLAERDK